MRRRWLLLAPLAGCATASSPGESALAPPKPNPPVRIVESKLGHEGSIRQEPMVLPFGVNQDATELILILLDRARADGAAWVGDLDSVVTFRWNGTPVECHARLVFEGEPAVAATAAPAQGELPAYGTSLEEYRPRRVGVTAEETVYRCKQGQITHARKKVRDDVLDHLDVSGGGAGRGERMPRTSDVEIVAEPTDDCVKERVKRHAERFDYEVKLGLVPPDLEYLSRRYADGKLVSAPPVCYRVAEVREPIYRLTATAFHRSRTVRRPVHLPAGDMRSTETQPETMSLDAAQQRCASIGRKDCGLDLGENGYVPKRGNAEWKQPNGPWLHANDDDGE